MKQVLIIHIADSKLIGRSGYCVLVREQDALKALKETAQHGLNACLEYDQIPVPADANPDPWDWERFWENYQKIHIK